MPKLIERAVKIGPSWEIRKYVSHHREYTYQVRRDPVTGKIEKVLVKSEPAISQGKPKIEPVPSPSPKKLISRPATTFEEKYQQLVEEDEKKRVPETMLKTVPDHVREALKNLSRSKNEYAIGIDFEENMDLPERVHANRGDTSSVLRDEDMELCIHTHPPSGYHESLESKEMTPKNKNAFGTGPIPSGSDMITTEFNKPSVIVHVDEDGKEKFVLVRSIKKNPGVMNKINARRKLNHDINMILTNKFPLKTRKVRDDAIEEIRKLANEQGYDFEETTLENPIRVKLDDRDERTLHLKRYNSYARRIMRDFNKNMIFEKLDVRASLFPWEMIIRIPKNISASDRNKIDDQLKGFISINDLMIEPSLDDTPAFDIIKIRRLVFKPFTKVQSKPGEVVEHVKIK